MNIVSVVAFGLIATILAVVLKQYKPEYAIIISIAAVVVILISVISMIVPIISEVKTMIESAEIPYRYIMVLIKSLGICYITQFACDVCKDAGQTAVSNKIELAGRVAICLSAIPLYKDLLSITQTIIGKVI